MKQQTLAVLMGTLVLAGCATAPTLEQLADADYGQYPAEYQAIIDAHLRQFLKDPTSAQYEHIHGPRSGWSSYFGPVQYGYYVCASINAKNSFGAYTGYKTHYFLLHNGSVIQHIHGKGGSYDIGSEVARQRCGIR